MGLLPVLAQEIKQEMQAAAVCDRVDRFERRLLFSTRPAKSATVETKAVPGGRM